MQRPQRGTGARPRLRSVSVQDELRQRIDRGELPAGTRLPSEPELAAELQVSRATLREALRAMELEGLLRRRQGSGTFVASHPRMANSLDVNFGVTDAIRAAGMTAGIAHRRHWVEPASAGEAALLELEPGQDVLVIERVRTAEGKPVVLSRDLFPSRLVAGNPQAVEAMLERSIYDVLERDLGIVIHHGVARFRPVRADHSRGRAPGRAPRRAAALPLAGRLRPGRHPGDLLARVPSGRRVRLHRRPAGPWKEAHMTSQAATTQVGTAMRLKRVIDPAGVSIICALDHGMTSPTFLEPLAAIGARTAEVVAGGANVIMMSKGMIRLAEPAFSPTTSLALLLSASANPADPQPEVIQIAQVEEAVRLGADAVVLFTALGGDTEAGMIRTLAGVGRECAAMGMPLIAEAEFPTTYAAVEQLKEQYGFEYLRRNVRLCAELGADIVKTNWPGDGDSFARLVEAAAGIPLVLAGGSRLGDRELLQRMEAATAAGGIGCSVGRNIFMHRSPEAITRALSRVIRERWSADKAFDELQETAPGGVLRRSV